MVRERWFVEQCRQIYMEKKRKEGAALRRCAGNEGRQSLALEAGQGSRAQSTIMLQTCTIPRALARLPSVHARRLLGGGQHTFSLDCLRAPRTDIVETVVRSNGIRPEPTPVALCAPSLLDPHKGAALGLGDRQGILVARLAHLLQHHLHVGAR
jgi:hypothetical protein